MLTRFFPPSRTLIWPFIHFIQEQTILKECPIRNNLIRFAECYANLDEFAEGETNTSMGSVLEKIDFLVARKSELGRFEL